MKKILTKIIGASLAIAMMIGVGAGLNYNKTANEADATSGASITSFSAVSADFDTNIQYTSYKGGGTSNPAVNSNQIRLYQGNGTNAGGMLVVKVKSTSSVRINAITVGTGMNTTLGYKVGTEYTTSTKVSNFTSLGSVNNGDTKTVSGLDTNVVTFACLGTSSSSRWYVNHLSVTYSEAAQEEPEHIYLTGPSGNLEVGDTYQFEYSFDKGNDTIASWASDDESVATVSDSGLVTAVGNGTATITITSTGGLTNTCDVTVNAPTTKTVAQAMDIGNALANNATDPITYSINGYITSVATAWDNQNNYLTYYLGDSIDSAQPLQIYRSGAADGTNGSELKIGDRVNVIGRLKKYNNAPELINGVTTLVEAATAEDVTDVDAVATTKTVAEVKAYTVANNTMIAKVTGVAENLYDSEHGRFYLADPSTGDSVIVYGGYLGASFEKTANVYNTKESSMTTLVTSDIIGHSVTVYSTIGAYNSVGQLVNALVVVGDACTSNVAASVTANNNNMGVVSISSTSISYGSELVVSPVPFDTYRIASVVVQRASKNETLNAQPNGTYVFNAQAKNQVVVNFESDSNAFVSASLAKYTIANTYSGTAVTNTATIKGWFTLESGDDILSSVSANPSKVYPGAHGGNSTTSWDLDNAIKIGQASAGGSMTLNLSEQVNRVVITGYMWKDNVTLTIGSASISNALSGNLANKTNVEAGNEGTVIADITSASSITISTNSAAVVITSIEFFAAKTAKAVIEESSTNASLSYDYDAVNDTFSNVAIRFGGCVDEALWNKLDTASHNIVGVGVLFTNSDRIASLENVNSIKDCFDDEMSKNDNNIENSISAMNTNSGIIYRYATIDESMPALVGEHYVWNLCKKVSSSYFAKEYVAVAFIRTKTGIVFLNETAKSVKQLAIDLRASDPETYNDSYREGSLKQLAQWPNGN